MVVEKGRLAAARAELGRAALRLAKLEKYVLSISGRGTDGVYSCVRNNIAAS